MDPERSNPRAAITLFFVAPFVAEYLLGDLGLKLLPVIFLMAPMYGGGAILIRETARRTGRGWPTMLMLGMAYALLEEGLVTQSLFNPNYLGFHFLVIAAVPALGISAWWTLLMLNLHTFWSMGVSIALVEGLFPSPTQRPWLRRTGTTIVAILFVLGVAAGWHMNYRQNHGFTAGAAKLASAAILCLLLVVAAFLLPRRSRPSTDAATVPSPWIAGLIVFVLGFLFELVPPRLGWGAVALQLAIDAIFLAFLAVFARRARWSPLHTCSVAAAGALIYGIHAFLQPPLAGGSGTVAVAGHIIFLAIALALIAIGARRSAAPALASST